MSTHLNMIPVNETKLELTGDPVVPDHAFDRLLPELIECFAVIVIGALAGKLKLFNKAEAAGLNNFAANFALPALIFVNLAQLDLTDVQWPFVIGIFLGKILVFLVVALVTLTASRSADLAQAAIYAIFATHVNDFGFAYPILQAVYGESHPSYPNYIYLIGLISLAILNPVGFLMIEIQRVRESKPADAVGPQATTTPSPQTSSGKRRRQACRMICSIVRKIITNPNVFMTVLGAIANVLFHARIPDTLTGILKDFSDTFEGSVLFLLGLQVASTPLGKNSNYVIPALLLTTKMLISPLITRGTVKLLCTQAPDASALSDYGFLYGTVPTAPVVLVYASQFSLPTETMAIALVLCTLLSGPVMYVSARMLVVQAYDILSYMTQLRETILCLSAFGLFSCLWVVFIVLLGRKWRKPPHSALLLLVMAQGIMSVGLLIWSIAPSDSTWTTYLDISAVTGGQLACRFCTVTLAIVLYLSPKYSAEGMRRYLPFFVFFGFGLPGVAVLCLLVTLPPTSTLSDMNLVPSFLFGDTEACMAVVVLSFCLVATTGCLLLFHRQRVRSRAPSLVETTSDVSPVLSDSSELSTIQEESAKQIAEETENPPNDRPPPVAENEHRPQNDGRTAHVSVVMEYEANALMNSLQSPENTKRLRKQRRKKNLTVISANLPGLMGKQSVAWEMSVSAFKQEKEVAMDSEEIQADKHFVHLLCLCVSMIVGLTTSIWKLLAEERTGLFVALEFLDIILNFGQPILCVFIFGHNLEPILEPIRKLYQKLSSSNNRTIPPPEPTIVDQEPHFLQVTSESPHRRSSGPVTGLRD